MQASQNILFQKDRRSRQDPNPVPVPNCSHWYPGTEHSFHADPHFGEASILVDALRRRRDIRCQSAKFLAFGD